MLPLIVAQSDGTLRIDAPICLLDPKDMTGPAWEGALTQVHLLLLQRYAWTLLDRVEQHPEVALWSLTWMPGRMEERWVQLRVAESDPHYSDHDPFDLSQFDRQINPLASTWLYPFLDEAFTMLPESVSALELCEAIGLAYDEVAQQLPLGETVCLSWSELLDHRRAWQHARAAALALQSIMPEGYLGQHRPAL